MKTLRLWKLVIVGVVLSLFAAEVRADDKQKETERKVKVALALAAAKKAEPAKPDGAAGAASNPATTPAPREVAELLPVVVYVACVGPECSGAFKIEAKDYPGVAGPAVLVQYPAGDRMVTEKTFRGCPTREDLQRAVDAATKKTAGQRDMPPKAKVEAQAKAAACPCGDGCQCKPGECPANCPKPAAAPRKPEPVLVGYRQVRYCDPQTRKCYLVDEPIFEYR